MTEAFDPITWLRSVSSILDEIYASHHQKLHQKIILNDRGHSSARKNNSSAVKRSSVLSQSYEPSVTPLRNKGNSPALLSVEAIPMTEGRLRRTAATKATKYIDIVTRRLAEVPANGSTPKSMKNISSKLLQQPISKEKEKSQTAASTTTIKTTGTSDELSANFPLAAATPRIRKNQESSSVSLVAISSLPFATPSSKDTASDFSPSTAALPPSVVSKRIRATPLKVEVNEVQSSKKSSKKTSPKRTAEASTNPPIVSLSVVPSVKAVAPIAPSTPQVIPQNVEFVAPSSILRSSKRSRKPATVYDESSPIVKRPNLIYANEMVVEPVTINAIQQNSTAATSVIINTFAPAIAAPASILIPKLGSHIGGTLQEASAHSSEELSTTFPRRTPLRVAPPRTPSRSSKASVIPMMDYSAATKLAVNEVAKNLASNANNYNPSINPTSSLTTPKVEPWTARFNQQSNITNNTAGNVRLVHPSHPNLQVKPVDTSKISGLGNNSNNPKLSIYTASTIASNSLPVANVPVVPKFPLNLANISALTKSTRTILVEPSAASVSSASTSILTATTTTTTTSSSKATAAQTQIPPESPLTRAKRIDSENNARDAKLKNIMTDKAEQLKRAIGELRSSSELGNTSTSSIISSSGETGAGSKSIVSTPNDHNTRAMFNVSMPSASVASEPSKAKPQHATLATTVPTTTNLNTTVMPTTFSSANVQASSKLPVKPNPKVPSRLAEAFTGIESELPPIDLSLKEEDRLLTKILSGESIKKPQSSDDKSVALTTPSATAAAQLHKTAVLNSAAKTVTKPIPSTPKVAENSALPATPHPSNSSNTSPILPEIPSDDDEDVLDKRAKLENKENRPTWATTPNLTVALNAQRFQRAEDVFGKVQPIKLEDFFKGSGKKFPNRSSTSNWNHM